MGAGLGAAGKYLAPGLSKGLHAAGDFVGDPVKTVREGWKSMSPVKNPERMKEIAARGMESAAAAAKKGKDASPGATGVAHHFAKSRPLGEAVQSGGVKGVAEELSRRGWTGQGAATKYMPVGDKGMAAGFGALAAPTAVRPFLGKGTFEEAGKTVGGHAGFMAAPELGFVAGTVPMAMGEKAMGGAGKVLDVGLGYHPKPPPAMQAPLGEQARG